MSLRALQESLQSAAWTPPQRRFFEQLIAYVLPRTLLPGSGIDITQDAALGTLTFSAQAEARTLVFQYDISGDETTTLTTGTAKRTWRMPIPFTLCSAYASLTTGSSSGAVIVDVNADNSSVFGTNKLSIDQGEESSFTATTAVDLTEQLIDADAELTFDVDDDGTNAVGLKVYLVGVYAFDTELLMFGPLDDMAVGAAYSDTLSVLSGVKPYSITTPQSLPDGITVTLNGGNNTPMTISGTPTGAGLGPGTSIPFLIRATVQDAANDVYTFSQTVTITAAAVVATIDGGALPDATVGVAYSHDIDATGGVGAPYIFSLQSGTLPAGITLDSSTGALTGTPTTAGTHTLTFRATDSEGNYDDVTDTIEVTAAGGDPYWSSVIALLHMNGTDGSGTFTDETGRTWGRLYNAFIDTGQSVFGGASAEFTYSLPNQAGIRVTSDNADFNFGSDDFCIQMRVRHSVISGDYRVLMAKDSTVATRGWILLVDPLDSAGKIGFYFRDGGTTYSVVSTSVPSVNTWYAVAVSRVGSSLRLFVNGTLEATTSVGSATINTTSHDTWIGLTHNSAGKFEGWVDEVRVTRGEGRYTASYTLETAEFPNS